MTGQLQTSFTKTFVPSPGLHKFFAVILQTDDARRGAERLHVLLLEAQGVNAS